MSDRIGIRGILIGLLLMILASLPAGAQDWTLCNRGKIRPPARYCHAMAYDAARQRVVVCGGMDYRNVFDDTWEWDGNAWTQCSTVLSITMRSGHAVAYDSARQRVVLFGGIQGWPPYVLNDTWEWNGKDWTQRAPASSPPARGLHAMAYDSARQRTVLFGGTSGGNDTWEWDGNNWTQRFPATSPPGRSCHAFVYDSARRRTVLFGGGGGANFLNDTWEWDGSNWTQCSPTTRPPARYDYGMAYDSARRRTVLFGGATPAFINDTWEWDGSSWVWQATATSPTVRTCHAMAYDISRQRIVIFGGQLFTMLETGETWEYGLPATVVATGTSRPGTTVNLVLTAAADAGLGYQAGTSLGTGPIPVGSRRIGLSPDALLQVSTGDLWPWIFRNYRGTLDQRGLAAPAIHIPNLAALIGTRIRTAFVTLDPQAPHGIRSISQTFSFSVVQ